jgi:hypothetical protein
LFFYARINGFVAIVRVDKSQHGENGTGAAVAGDTC